MTARTTARRVAQIRPTPTATVAQISAHCALTAHALADGRITDAIDLLSDADNIGAKSPLLDLCRAVLHPAAEDFSDHVGNESPVPAGTLVAVLLDDGPPVFDIAGALAWGAGAGPDGEGRIHRYAVVALQH